MEDLGLNPRQESIVFPVTQTEGDLYRGLL